MKVLLVNGSSRKNGCTNVALQEVARSLNEENIETELNIKDVFWQFTDREIPIPALIALREGIADGSIRPDIDIHMIYQILVNAYTGTNIYDGTKYAIDPVETLRTSSAIIANYIKNDT